jgi:hypothetical protein
VQVKELQMANGKEQMANVRPFEFRHLPFEIALSVCPVVNL